MPSEPRPSADGERRLPQVALLFALLSSLQRYALPLLAVLIFSRGNGYERWLLLLLLPSFGYALLKYFTFTYTLGHDELVIRSGLLSRQERHLPYARIQNVDLRQNLLHRLAKVAVVRLETGSGGDAEAEIEVLTESAIAELRAAVLRRSAPAQTAALVLAPEEAPLALPASIASEPAARPLLELGATDLVLRGLLTGRGFILVAAATGFLQQTGIVDFGDQAERLGSTFGFDGAAFAQGDGSGKMTGTYDEIGIAAWLQSFLTWHNLAIFFVLGAVLWVATRVLSILWTLATFWDFRLVRRGDSLSTEQGLFTRVSATLPRHRIQALELRTGFLDGLFGRAAVVAATAGRGITGDDQAKNPSAENAELFLAPILRKDDAQRLLRDLAPEHYQEGLEWRGFAAGTFGRLLRKRLLLLAAFLALAYWLLGPLGAAAVIVIGAFEAVSLQRYVRRSRWALGSSAIFWRSGSFGEIAKMVPLEKIQVVSLLRSPFDRRRGTATLQVDTAATDTGYPTLHLPYLDAADASALADRLERETGRRHFRW